MPDANTPTPSADTWVEGANHAYYQTWVPFQSGALSETDSTFGSAMDGIAYTVAYGLKSPFAPQQMGTFLHLGALDPEMVAPATATDPQKKATYTRANNLAAQVTQFVDDTRQRSGTATDPSARQNESLLLSRKGGWRDHTDGNRISTTVGDKVEVIGGNSVLVILGRPTKDNNLDPDTWAAGYGTTSTHQIESSGWMGYENDGAPGHVEEVRWVDDEFGGTWMVREKTYANDTVSIGSGSVRESFVGQSVELNSGNSISYHGRLADIPDALKGNAAFNPANIKRDEQDQSDFPYSKDMAKAEDFIASVTKNAAATFDTKDVPQAVIEYARLDSVLSDTLVTGNVSETTVINGNEVEVTTVGGDTTETNTVSGTVTESLTADHVSDTTSIRLTKSEVETVGGNLASVTAIGGMREEVTVVGAGDISVATGLSRAEITLIPAQSEIEVTLDRVNVFVGVGKQEIDLCPYVYEYGGDKIEFSAMGTIAAATMLTLSAPTLDLQGVANLGLPPVIAAALGVEAGVTVGIIAATVAA